MPTQLNVADDATKWTNPTISLDDRWFSGPSYIKLPEEHWPKQPELAKVPEESMHVKKAEIRFHLMEKINANCMSRWSKLRRVIALRLRFLEIKLKKNPIPADHLTPEELRKAEEYMFRSIQFESYISEYFALSNNQSIEPDSDLYKLSPMMDELGTIRFDSTLT